MAHALGLAEPETSRPPKTETSQRRFTLQAPRRRRDLRIQQTENLRWNVLDPITRQSYRVGLVEHWLLTRPDGRLSPTQLLAQLRADLPDVTWSDEQLWASLSAFRLNGLLSDAGTQHIAVTSASPGSWWQAWLASLVVWQIRGWQPDAWLTRVAPYTNFLFSATAVRTWLVLSLVTWLLVILDFKRLSTQALSLDWILHPAATGWLFFAFVVTRGLHELGHALVCKRFGVRCPDIGVFVILGAPCVYCDVSESWQLPRRWQRGAVAAAGMYVELIVATCAGWLWLLTVAGPVNTLALQTMLICSISTLAININPLMRFDGYYLLSDWLDEVNLRGKADAVAGSYLRWLTLGINPQAASTSRAKRPFLLTFSLAGWVYRGLLSITVATVIVTIYSGWQLPWIGRILAVVILFSWWGVPAMKLVQDLIQLARQQRRLWRLSLVSAVLVLLVGMLPIPSRQLARGWLQPSEFRGVYASNTAHLVACHVRDGALVEQDKPIFELHSHDLVARQIQYEQAVRVAEIRVAAARRRRDMHNQEVDLAQRLHQLNESQTWLANAQRELELLTLTAPVAGRLIAMPATVPAEPSAAVAGNSLGGLSRSGETGQAASHWCDRQQLGRVVPVGSLLASVCGEQLQGVLPLTQRQLSQVAVGTEVRVRIAGQGSVLRRCRVQSIVQLDQLDSPWQATALHALQSSPLPLADRGQSRLAAVVALPPEITGYPGATVDAVFIGQPTTLTDLAILWLHDNLRMFAD